MTEREKEHFRLIAKLFTQIEEVVVQKWRMVGVGLSIRDVDTFLQQHGVNVTGASVMWSFIKQSDEVMLSPDEHYLVPKPKTAKGRQVGDGMVLIDGVKHK